jgi:mono/diheme cytochrome c family protein
VRAGLAGTLAALAFAAQAQDAERGRVLYETYCNECHYERVHDRLRSEVKDLADLRDVVWRRAREVKRRSFSLDELDAITEYLNTSHYRFGLAPKKR